MNVAIYIPYIPDENTMPPLGPLYMLSVLEKNGFNVRMFDAKIEKDAIESLLDFKPDVVGISAVTAGYNNGLKTAKAIKKYDPNIKIVFGGPHPSASPEEVIKEQAVDFVFRGESEIPFCDLCLLIKENELSQSSLKQINNLFYKGGKDYFSTQSRAFLTKEELDALPYPAFHKMNINAYFASTQSHGLFRKGKRILPVMSARGCPSNCTFCCRMMGSKIRERSVESVVSEIKYLIDTYRVDEIYFEDDNFTLNKKRAIEILDKISDFKPKIFVKFANGVRADKIDEELLIAMKKAGVYSLSFGIESGCRSTLEKMEKNLDLVQARKNVLLAKSMGFLVGSNCIIGYPGETIGDIHKSLKYFLSLPLDSMAIVNLVPFPGTKVREICVKNGYLTQEAVNWDNYYFSVNKPVPLIETPEFSKEQIIKLVGKAYKNMYINPRWAVKNIKYLSFNQVLKGALKVLKI